MPTVIRRPRRRLSQEQLRALRHQQAKKARKGHRDLARIHQRLPKQAGPCSTPLAPAFRQPTHHRFVLLAVAAILTLGGRTIRNLLRCLGALAPDIPPVITGSSPTALGLYLAWGSSEFLLVWNLVTRRSASRCAAPVPSFRPSTAAAGSTAAPALAIKAAGKTTPKLTA